MMEPTIYLMIPRLDVEFSPSVEEFYKARAENPVTVLSGSNNCGKTLLLKKIWEGVGPDCYMVACNRFFNIDVLNNRRSDPREYRRFYENFARQSNTSHQNADNNEFQLDGIIAGLTNQQRGVLFDLCQSLVGNKFELSRVDPDNDLSPYYISMDGENLKYGSTGTRSLLTLLGILLNEHLSIILIDEPELSLNPRIQSSVARLLYSEEGRAKFFPHLRQIFVATHSHLFLDRSAFSNNFSVSKSGRDISVRQVRSASDLHQLQFDMLGNDLESIFLPSGIVLVEGVSDVSFLTKVVQTCMPDRKVAVVGLGGEGNTLDRLRFLGETFGNDISLSPYCDRLFVVLDRKHSVSRKRIIDKGVKEENIVILSKNGIENYYPTRVLSKIFCCNEGEVSSIELESDPIEYNGIRKSKRELADMVCEEIKMNDPLDLELAGLVRRIETFCR